MDDPEQHGSARYRKMPKKKGNQLSGNLKAKKTEIFSI
jgi:hypothetical protein